MSERRLGGVLGEHGDAMFGTEFTFPICCQQQVRAAIERIVHVGPGHLPLTVDEGESGGVECGALLRETWHQGPIGRPLAGRSNPA